MKLNNINKYMLNTYVGFKKTKYNIGIIDGSGFRAKLS